MSVEEYLREYFRHRTDLFRETCPLWARHMERFFAPSYQFYDPDKSVVDSEAESIISVRDADGQAEVITSGSTGGKWRMRYRLSPAGDSWMIAAMEMECGICHGTGKARHGRGDCTLCKGVGWKLVGKTRNAA